MNATGRQTTPNPEVTKESQVGRKTSSELAGFNLTPEVEESLDMYRTLLREALQLHFNNEADESVNEEITALKDIMAHRFSVDRDLLEKIEKVERQSLISDMVSDM